MCWRSCAAMLLLSCCWPWLASADGSGGQPPATWAQLDVIWTSLESENDRRSRQLEERESTSALLATNLIASEASREELKRELELLKIELKSWKDSSAILSQELTASEAETLRAEQELTASQDSLRLADASVQASARSALGRSLLIGAGALGAGLLIGILVQ